MKAHTKWWVEFLNKPNALAGDDERDYVIVDLADELEKARALLARGLAVDDWTHPLPESWLSDVRAFLDPRRDEAPRECLCGEPLRQGQHHQDCPARDEARRCPCLQWEPEVRGSRSFHVPGCEYAPHVCDPETGCPVTGCSIDRANRARDEGV